MSTFNLGRLFRLPAAVCMVAAALSGADYLPLEPGNTWMYRNNATGSTFTVRVSTPAVIGGKIYYALQGYVGSMVMVRMDANNALVYLDNETNQERPLVSFTPFQGGWLHAPYRPCEQESQTQERRTAYSGPVGQFQDVLSVRYRSFGCADAGTELEQFAENVGMLRRVEQSFAGPQQYDLVFAKVGGAVIQGLPTGSFSVTLDQVNGSNTLTAVMRLRLHGAPVIKLMFPTGQEYDLALVDGSGNVVWRWSDGKFFPQMFHEKSIAVEWTIPVQFPRPGGGSGPQARNYTLQAWLTTAGAAPQFAASVPVTIMTPVR